MMHTRGEGAGGRIIRIKILAQTTGAFPPLANYGVNDIEDSQLVGRRRFLELADNSLH